MFEKHWQCTLIFLVRVDQIPHALHLDANRHKILDDRLRSQAPPLDNPKHSPILRVTACNPFGVALKLCY
jgi:hypothetical protein